MKKAEFAPHSNQRRHGEKQGLKCHPSREDSRETIKARTETHSEQNRLAF